jgi:hypothetical protein
MEGDGYNASMNEFGLENWWPDHVRRVFIAVGAAMRSNKLYPEDLSLIPQGAGAILPDHVVTVVHVSAKGLKKRRGQYVIRIRGPRLGGEWRFASRQLERLALRMARN